MKGRCTWIAGSMHDTARGDREFLWEVRASDGEQSYVVATCKDMMIADGIATWFAGCELTPGT